MDLSKNIHVACVIVIMRQKCNRNVPNLSEPRPRAIHLVLGAIILCTAVRIKLIFVHCSFTVTCSCDPKSLEAKTAIITIGHFP